VNGIAFNAQLSGLFWHDENGEKRLDRFAFLPT
jgi:hypothetical protein